MSAFGALLWAVSWMGVVLVLGGAIAFNGLSLEGWRRTGRFYVGASLLTLPLSLWILSRNGAQTFDGLWVIVAAVRQIMCLPLALIGLGLALLAVRQKRRAIALVMAAILNVGGFVCLFVRGLD